MIKNKITFLLPSKGRLQYLKETIEDIEKNCSLPYEIFLIYCPVDKETADWALDEAEAQITCFPETMDSGCQFPNISKSCNKAMEHATSEFVTWWSDDLLILPELFERMVEYLRENQGLAGVTVPVRNGDFSYRIDNFQGLSHHEFKWGLLRTAIYKEVGMLDEALPGYRCDTEFNLRLIAAAHVIGLLPTVRVKHRAVNDGTRGGLKTTADSGMEYMRNKWGTEFRLGRKIVVDQVPWFDAEAGAVFEYPDSPGEFGWEVMQWQGFVRRQARQFDKVRIIGSKSSHPLYADIANATLYGYDDSILGISEKETNYTWKKDQVIPHNQQEFIIYGTEKTEHPFDILFHARNAKHQEKNYPVDMWVELARMFYDAGYKVASIGNNAHHIEGTYDLTGESLDAIFDYMRSAKCIVGPSSGPMHLASLCNCPQVVWGDERVYVGGNTLETRYKTAWNPLGVLVDYITTTWDSPERWKPEPKAVFLRTERLIGFGKKVATKPAPPTDVQNLQKLQAAINAAMQGGKYLIEVHRKTEDLRAEYKHFCVQSGLTVEDINHCRSHFPGQIFINTDWK